MHGKRGCLWIKRAVMRRKEQKRERILLDRHPRLKCRGHDGLAYATFGVRENEHASYNICCSWLTIAA